MRPVPSEIPGLAAAGDRLATLSLLRLPGRHVPFALRRMAGVGGVLARDHGVPGAAVRLLGSGGGALGFSAAPRLGHWGLLVPRWPDAATARTFLEASPWFGEITRRADEVLHLWLDPISGHGAWDGAAPFAAPPPRDAAGERVAPGPLAVLTRATVRAAALPGFFRASAAIEGELEARGAIFAIGLGELPWVRQATFSVWPDVEAMKRFAYGPGVHREVIAQARAKGWFAEDLFYRFRVLAARGSWQGGNPLGPSAGGAS